MAAMKSIAPALGRVLVVTLIARRVGLGAMAVPTSGVTTPAITALVTAQGARSPSSYASFTQVAVAPPALQ
jgi:hypothetical protein